MLSNEGKAKSALIGQRFKVTTTNRIGIPQNPSPSTTQTTQSLIDLESMHSPMYKTGQHPKVSDAPKASPVLQKGIFHAISLPIIAKSLLHFCGLVSIADLWGLAVPVKVRHQRGGSVQGLPETMAISHHTGIVCAQQQQPGRLGDAVRLVWGFRRLSSPRGSALGCMHSNL